MRRDQLSNIASWMTDADNTATLVQIGIDNSEEINCLKHTKIKVAKFLLLRML